MKFLFASVSFMAPALLAAMLGTAAHWTASVKSPLVARRPAARLVIGAEPASVDTRQIVPSLSLPDGARVQQANNSLDVVRHQGRVYLAFRTALSDASDASASIVVLSSEDEVHWRSETEVFLGTEVRHPAFLSLHGQLFLYASKLGDDRYMLNPHGVVVTTKNGDQWSDVRELDLPGHIVTQVGIDSGIPVMLASVGARSPYQLGAEEAHLRVLTTNDGYAWQAMVGQDDSALSQGATHASFRRDEDGNSVGVVSRQASGSQTANTSICLTAGWRSPEWDCDPTAMPLTNPSTFRVGLYTYVVGGVAIDQSQRSSLTAKPSRAWPEALRPAREDVDRLASRQRCGVWRIDTRTLELIAVAELPSRGQECNARVLDNDGSEQVIIYAVGSPKEMGDLSLVQAQRGASHIYRHQLRLPGGTVSAVEAFRPASATVRPTQF